MALALHTYGRMPRVADTRIDSTGGDQLIGMLEGRVRDMDDELARHALVIQTLLRICARKGLFADAEFLKLLEEVDLEDGVRDGKRKRSKAPRTCSNCGKNARATALTCLYCGTEFPTKNPV